MLGRQGQRSIKHHSTKENGKYIIPSLLWKFNNKGEFIMEKTPKELMKAIKKMLKGNYRAMYLVYAYLLGLTGGAGNGK